MGDPYGAWSMLRRQCRRRAMLRIFLAGIVALAAGPLAPRAARAQLDDGPLHSQRDREREYQQLADDVEELEKPLGIIKRVVRLASPTVVHIEASKTEPIQLRYGHRGGGVEEAGSGVVISLADKNFVLTNRHVIKFADAPRIKIRLADGRQIYPTQVWSDKGTDVAVMAVDAEDLISARLGDSDRMEIGDFVVAVGSPFGLSHSVTSGIISAKGRRDLELGEEGVPFQDFMQTDAAINPGNSGGPLINLRGEVIGINTAIASASGGNEGIGFTIPVNMVMVIARQLIERGSVTRAFLGVNLDSKFRSVAAANLGLPRPRGARITGITPDSPASEAKLEVDDVILQFNGIPVEDDNHLVNMVGLTEVGRQVTIVVFRNREVFEATVRVGDRSRYETPN
jgi:serine protease Do